MPIPEALMKLLEGDGAYGSDNSGLGPKWIPNVQQKVQAPASAQDPMIDLMQAREVATPQPALDLGTPAHEPNSLEMFQQYISSPQRQALRKEETAQSKNLIAQHIAGADRADEMLKKYLAGEDGKINLAPLMALSDAWAGTNLAKGYKGPASDDEKMAKAVALQDLSNKRRADAAREQIDLTKSLLSDQDQLAMARLGQTQNRNDMKRLTEFGDALDPNKGRAGEFGRQQQTVNNADRILVLKDQNPSLNFDSRQIEELALATASLLTGGSRPAESVVHALVPKSVGRNAAAINEWINSEPTGTAQQAFVKRMVETAERERELAVGKVRDIKLSRIAQFESTGTIGPEQLSNIMRSHGVDPTDYQTYKFNGYSAPKSAPAQSSGGFDPNEAAKVLRQRGIIK